MYHIPTALQQVPQSLISSALHFVRVIIFPLSVDGPSSLPPLVTRSPKMPVLTRDFANRSIGFHLLLSLPSSPWSRS